MERILLRGIIIFLIAAGGMQFAGAEPVPLFTEDELQRLDHSEKDWQEELALFRDRRQLQQKSLGPLVTVIVPQAADDVFVSFMPLRLLVFLKKRMAPIDIDSLSIEGRYGIFSLDITKRILPFLRPPEAGEDADYVIDASLPHIGPGRYLITMSLQDNGGNAEEISAFVEVRRNQD